MPTRTAGSRLSGLVFIDAPDDPAWSHRVVPASGSDALPTDLRPLDVQIAGAGTMWSLDGWRDETHTTSLLVLHGATVVHEGPTGVVIGRGSTRTSRVAS